MPALKIDSNALILVSGANGFIAVHVIRALLEKGYRVRGTVRSAAKIPHLEKIFASYGDKLKIVVVPDITADGAFDEAVNGVDAVEHTSSPTQTHFDDPQEAIRPAVQGITSIIRSVIKNGISVKRVVLTSSCGAIYHESDKPQVFTEADWNDQAWRVVEEKGREAPGIYKYWASKTLAEQAAWKLWEDNKAKVGWDLTTINPPLVFGVRPCAGYLFATNKTQKPPMQDVKTVESLNSSMQIWWNAVLQHNKTVSVTKGSSWIDVRDVGLAHALALEKEDAGGKRLLVSAGPYIWQDFIDAVNDIHPVPYPDLPKGVPDIDRSGVVDMITYDNRKTTELIGLGSERPYITKEQCTRDMINDFIKRGWKP